MVRIPIGVMLLVSDGKKGEPKRRQATELRRRKILDAALVCFLNSGVQATSMEQICAKAGASNGSLYHLFRSKDEIAFALFVEGMQRYHGQILAELSRRRTARTIISAVIETHLKFTVEEPDFSLYLTRMGMAEERGEIAQQYKIISDQFQNELYSHLAPFVDSGEIIAYPIPLVRSLILGPTIDLCRAWLRNQISEDPRAAMNDLAEAAWRSLCATDSK